MSRVLQITVPDVFFLAEEQSDGASKAGQVSQPVQACEPRLGGPVQADRTSIFFWSQVNVHQCHEFRSYSKNKVRQCENFLVMF